MSVLRESYTVEASLPDFINIEYRSLRETKFGPADMGGSLWFERQHLPWLVDALESCLTIYAIETLRLGAGHDNLKVLESGHEAAPYINIYNKRPDGAPHAGKYWISLTKPLAQKLLEELRRLVDTQSSTPEP